MGCRGGAAAAQSAGAKADSSQVHGRSIRSSGAHRAPAGAAAAADPSRHAWVLLHAVVRAGNVSLLRQLLQQEPGAVASGSSSTPAGSASGGERPTSTGSMQDPGVLQYSQQVPRQLVPQLPLANLAPTQWAVLLLCALDGMESTISTAPFTEAQHLDSRQKALADAVWEAVGRQPYNAQQKVQQLVGAVCLEVVPGRPDSNRTAKLLHVCAEAKPGKLLWLHWHGCLPPVQRPSAHAGGAAEGVPEVFKGGLHSMAMKLCVTAQLEGFSVVKNLASQLGVNLALVSLCVTATMAAAVSDAAGRADAQEVLRLSAAQELFRRSLELCVLRGAAWQARPELVNCYAGVWRALNNSGGSGMQQAGSPSTAAGTAEPASGAAACISTSEGNSVGSGPAASTSEGVLRLWELAALALTRIITPADANAPAHARRCDEPERECRCRLCDCCWDATRSNKAGAGVADGSALCAAPFHDTAPSICAAHDRPVAAQAGCAGMGPAPCTKGHAVGRRCCRRPACHACGREKSASPQRPALEPQEQHRATP